MKNNIRKYADDLLFIVGLMLILIGTYQLSHVAAWFVAGVECLIAAFVVAGSTQ